MSDIFWLNSFISKGERERISGLVYEAQSEGFGPYKLKPPTVSEQKKFLDFLLTHRLRFKGGVLYPAQREVYQVALKRVEVRVSQVLSGLTPYSTYRASEGTDFIRLNHKGLRIAEVPNCSREDYPGITRLFPTAAPEQLLSRFNWGSQCTACGRVGTIDIYMLEKIGHLCSYCTAYTLENKGFLWTRAGEDAL